MDLTIRDDMDLEKIVGSGQCFRARMLSEDTARFITGRHALQIRDLRNGRFQVSCRPEEWERIWTPYFDLGSDYAALRRSLPEGFVKKASEEGKGIRILRQDPWETLISFILSQRKSIPAITRCVETLCALLGSPIPDAAAEGLCSFPSPEALAAATDEELDRCAPGYRLPYLKDAAKKTAEGTLRLKELEKLDDEKLEEALRSVLGVGVKVASCVMLFAYGRKSAAPVDTWISRIIDREYGGKDPFPGFGDQAGILQQYAFYYALRHKEEFS